MCYYASRISLTKRSDGNTYRIVLANSRDSFILMWNISEREQILELIPDTLIPEGTSAGVGGVFIPGLNPSEVSHQRVINGYMNTDDVQAVRLSLEHYSDMLLLESAERNWLDSRLASTAVESQGENVENTPSARPATTTGGWFDPDDIAILHGYGTERMFSGFGGYHSNSGSYNDNRPEVTDPDCRVGVELEMFARSRDNYNEIIRKRTNWFICESDSSLHGDFPIEMKTIPINLSDAVRKEFWEPAMDWFKSKAKSKNNNSSGLHVHFGREIFGEDEPVRKKNISKLVYFYCTFVKGGDDSRLKEINTLINGRQNGYCACNPSDVINAGLTPMAMLYKDHFSGMRPNNIERFMQPFVDEVYNSNSRHRWDINLQAYGRYGTVEFRLPKGIISSTRIAAVIGYYKAMILYTKTHEIWEYNREDFITLLTSNPNIAFYIQGDEEA